MAAALLAVAGLVARRGLDAARRARCSARSTSRLALAGCHRWRVSWPARSLTPSWDLSENRMNSFSRADEHVLRDIREPLGSRRTWRRRIRDASISSAWPSRSCGGCCRACGCEYVANTSTGLFEQTREHYGEIWVRVGRPPRDEPRDHGRRRARGDLRPGGHDRARGIRDDIFRGHPLAAPPSGAAAVFYGIWPALVVVAGMWFHRRQV